MAKKNEGVRIPQGVIVKNTGVGKGTVGELESKMKGWMGKRKGK